MIALQALVSHSVVVCHVDVVVVAEIDAARISLLVADDVYVGAVNVLQCPPTWVDSDSHCTVDPCDLDTIARPHFINEVFVGAEVYRLRGLTFGHRLWSLLHLHVLLVGEEAQVVVDPERLDAVASFALVWLRNLSFLDKAALLSLALGASECSLLHFGNDV